MSDAVSATTLMQRRSLEAMLASGAGRFAEPSRELAALDMKRGLSSRDPEVLLEEFQNILLSEMVKAMRRSVPDSGLFGDNSGQDMFESFLDEEYVRSLGRQTGGLGMTEALREQLGLNREVYSSPSEAVAAAREPESE